MKTKHLLSMLVLISLLFVTAGASARPLNAALSTGFTYQGKLTDGGSPANGTCDFQFGLYDASSGGIQLGSTQTVNSVSVSNGLFTVTLNGGGEFGASAFDGNARYLDIAVRCPAGSGGYTPLTPRQALTATPYAIYASKAPWSGLTGMPAGFADGMDNGSAYQNVKVVAKSGGDFTTITAALASILDAAADNHYLIYVAPGVYTEQVTMKQYVDIEGAGELTTKITFAGSALATTGTVLGANDAELRFLTVENTGGNPYAIAIRNSSASPRLTHVTASASGGTLEDYGVLNYSSSPTMTNVSASASGGTTSYGVSSYASSPMMTNVTASASGGTINYGVHNSYSSPPMTNVTASASGGTWNYGVYNSGSLPTMTNVTASASGGIDSYGVYNYNSSSPTMTNVTANASGGTNNYGVHNYDSSSPTMTSVTANASGGTNSYGVYNDSSLPTINNSVISASGGTDNYGIYNYAPSGAYTVLVNNSQISGSTNTIYNDPNFTTRVGASQLDGGAVFVGGGTFTCIGAYDENYVALDATCQ